MLDIGNSARLDFRHAQMHVHPVPTAVRRARTGRGALSRLKALHPLMPGDAAFALPPRVVYLAADGRRAGVRMVRTKGKTPFVPPTFPARRRSRTHPMPPAGRTGFRFD